MPRRPPLPPGWNEPYYAPPYVADTSRLQDLIRNAGRDQAEAQYARGSGWGNFFASIAPTILAAQESHRRDKQLKFMEARQESQSRAADALAEHRLAQIETERRAAERKAGQEKAWSEFLTDPMHNPEKPLDRQSLMRTAISIFGPEGAARAVEGAFGPEPKPVELSPGASLFDPKTGKVIFTAPKPDAPGAGFELGPGQTRFDASGKVIASVPARPPEESQARIWVMRPDAAGKLQPVRVRESEVRPGDRPASTREQGKPLTSGDANRLSDVDVSLKLSDNLITTATQTGAGSRIGAALPDVVTEVTGLGAESKGKQAQIQLAKQIIGKGLEGGVLRKEDEIKYEKMLPKIGDAPEVAAAKLRTLKQALQDKRDSMLQSYDDAGFDISKYRAREEAAAAKGETFDDANSYGYAPGTIIKNEKGERRLWNGKKWVAP